MKEHSYSTIADVIAYYVEPALGDFAAGYDLDAIAREIATWDGGAYVVRDPEPGDSDIVDAFNDVAERHALPGVVFADGRAWDFDAAVNLMDDEIREELHARGIEDKSAFLWEYIKAHREKFGEDFEA